jgi:predicted DNA-binding transcriptional regulator AlpA
LVRTLGCLMSNLSNTSSELKHDQLITRRQLQQLLPVSSMTIWRWERDGLLPKHLTIGRTSFWRAVEVHEYLSRAT